MSDGPETTNLPRPLTRRELVRLASVWVRASKSAKEFCSTVDTYLEVTGGKRKPGRPTNEEEEDREDNIAALVNRFESKEK